MHRARQEMPKTWVLKKKGTKYISANGNTNTVPIFVVIRDMMNIAKNRKEVKKILKEKEVKINNKKINDNKFPVGLNDTIEIDKKYYILILGENKKLLVKEIKENSDKKILKVINKKSVKNNKIQVNCTNGRNYLVDNKESKKIKVGCSVIVDLKNKKIIDILPLEAGKEVLIIKGKHIGKRGIIEKIDFGKKIAEIKSKNEKINVLLDYLMVEK